MVVARNSMTKTNGGDLRNSFLRNLA
jgi:hypothetical protein